MCDAAVGACTCSVQESVEFIVCDTGRVKDLSILSWRWSNCLTTRLAPPYGHCFVANGSEPHNCGWHC